MRLKYKSGLRTKLSFLATVLILIGIILLGCAPSGEVPRGWSGVAVSRDTLFVGSMQGKLLALNRADSRELWRADLAGTEKAPSGAFGCASAPQTVAVYGTPAVSGETVYVGGYNGKVYALNAASGAIRWVFPREGKLEGPIVGGLVAASGNLYFGAADGKVYSLDATTGERKWAVTTGDKVWATPVVQDNTLFIGSFDQKLYALNAPDGRKKWEFVTQGAITATPIVYKNTIYIGSFDRSLYALDITTGNKKWQFAAESWFWAPPVAYEDVIYAPNLDGKLYALRSASGEKLADFNLESPAASSPVVVGNSVVIASEKGKIFALDTATRQIRQVADLKEKVDAPLSASEGVVYIHAQTKDTLYAVRSTGAVLWSFSLSSK
ncbi:MAG: PQQ-binding-like beta-propeller repeat protein [Chloroflexota bacterium]